MNATERGIAAHQLLSDIRNARYETVWMHVQKLLEEPEIWRDFTAGSGRHYEFRSHEFDWFLAELTPDLDTLIRDAMVKAPPKLEMRYADVTGRGSKTSPEQRRSREELITAYPDAAKRLIVARPTPRRAVRFQTPEARKAHLAGESVTKERRRGQRDFRARVSGDADLAQAIVAKLNDDPDLYQQVEKLMTAQRVRTVRDKKRRSDDKI